MDQACGILPVCSTILNSVVTAISNLEEVFRNSLSIPSYPQDLLFLSFLIHFKTSSAEISFSKSSCTNISVSLSNVWRSSSSGMFPSFSKCSTKRSWLMASTVYFFWRLLLFKILQYARGSQERSDLILSWKTFLCIRLFLLELFFYTLYAHVLSHLWYNN